MSGSAATAFQNAPAGQSNSHYLLILAILATLAAFPGVFTLPPLDRDESRFAQATVQMLESGDFVRIRFQEDERNKKPAGIHWLQATSVAVLSDAGSRAIWAYRLPSALAAIAASMLTFTIGRRLFGERTGFAAGILIAAAPLVIGEASIAKTDAALLATITAALAAALSAEHARQTGRPVGRTQPYWFWAALGAGILIKGPIAPLVVGSTIGAYTAIRRDLGLCKALKPVRGALILAAMVAPWAIAIDDATDGRFFSEALGGDMAGKIGGAQEGHAGPPGLHLALLPLLFWPAAGLLPAAAAYAMRTRNDWRTVFLLSWFMPTFVVFELTATKLPHYVLPAYPAIALLAATAATAPMDGRVRIAGVAIHAIASLVIVIGLIALAVGIGDVGQANGAGALAAVVLAGAIGVIIAHWRDRPFRGLVGASLLSILLLWILAGAVAPRLPALAVSPRLSAAIDDLGLHPLRDGAPPVTLAGYREPSAIFLLGAATRLSDGATAALAAGSGGAVIVEREEQASFEAAIEKLGLAVEAVAQIDGINYSKGDPVHLSVYVLKAGAS
jgi:4-amino-4-deoxy-L-arabinose transferase-like glycosyltransferase